MSTIKDTMETHGASVAYAERNEADMASELLKAAESQAAAAGAAAKSRAKLQALLFGTMSIGLYAAVFANGDLLASTFARGGMYAALPIATVFLFSYVHGTFTDRFWSALGIEASKKVGKPAAKTAQPAKTTRKDTRPRATLQA